jgi:hypothetical protein
MRILFPMNRNPRVNPRRRISVITPLPLSADRDDHGGSSLLVLPRLTILLDITLAPRPHLVEASDLPSFLGFTKL